MRSPKTARRGQKFHSLRNQNTRKGKALRRQRSQMTNWICCTTVAAKTDPKRQQISDRKTPTLALSSEANKPHSFTASPEALSKKKEPTTNGKNLSVNVESLSNGLFNNDCSLSATSFTKSIQDSGIHSPMETENSNSKNGSWQSDKTEKSSAESASKGATTQNVEVFPSDIPLQVDPSIVQSQPQQIPARRQRTCKLLPKDIEFCVYMMEKHDQDFEKMSTDPKNVFHDSPEMIARKLRIFRDSSYFKEYQATQLK